MKKVFAMLLILSVMAMCCTTSFAEDMDTVECPYCYNNFSDAPEPDTVTYHTFHCPFCGIYFTRLHTADIAFVCTVGYDNGNGVSGHAYEVLWYCHFCEEYNGDSSPNHVSHVIWPNENPDMSCIGDYFDSHDMNWGYAPEYFD